MNLKRRFLVLFIVLMLAQAAHAQEEWPCDAALYITRLAGTASELFTFNRETADLILAGTSPDDYNALGYNPADNFMYGVDQDAGTYYRIGNDGVAIDISTPHASPGLGAPLPNNHWFAGDFWYNLTTSQWEHLVLEGGEGTTHRLVRVDPNGPDGPPIILNTFNINPPQLQWGDIAVHPVTDIIYGSPNDDRQLYEIDPDTGTATPVGPMVDPDGNEHYAAALFFDSYGQLWGYTDANGPGVPPGFNFENLVRIDTATGAVTPITVGDQTTRSDGASCPYTLFIEKTADPPSQPQYGVVTYTYRIRNNTRLVATGVSFEDSLPALPDARVFIAGSVVADSGNIEPGYGGTKSLRITDITVPPSSGDQPGIQTVRVDVAIGGTAPGTVYNQAAIFDLPPALNLSRTVSDYPPTNDYGDPTPLEIIAGSPPTTPENRDGVSPVERFTPSITKQSSRSTANLGDRLVFTIQVRNTGTRPGHGVKISEPVHPWLVITQAVASRGAVNINGNTVEVDIGTLNPDELVTLTIDAQVGQEAVAGGTLQNTAYLSEADGGIWPSNTTETTIGLGAELLPETGSTPIE